jgi:hypothetical protein
VFPVVAVVGLFGATIAIMLRRISSAEPVPSAQAVLPHG